MATVTKLKTGALGIVGVAALGAVMMSPALGIYESYIWWGTTVVFFALIWMLLGVFYLLALKNTLRDYLKDKQFI
jgi:hypothetical protein